MRTSDTFDCSGSFHFELKISCTGNRLEYSFVAVNGCYFAEPYFLVLIKVDYISLVVKYINFFLELGLYILLLINV